jgi:hypothetical protein
MFMTMLTGQVDATDASFQEQAAEQIDEAAEKVIEALEGMTERQHDLVSISVAPIVRGDVVQFAVTVITRFAAEG